MIIKIYLISCFYLCFLISPTISVNLQKTKKYIITHDNIFGWDTKTKKFKKNTGWWPPENTQIKGVEEIYLEVSATNLKIVEYYHHAYCSERTQTFQFDSKNKMQKINISSVKYNEISVYKDCEGKPELYTGTGKILSEDTSMDDLLNEKVKKGSVLVFWYYIPSKKEGVKMAIKLKAQ